MLEVFSIVAFVVGWVKILDLVALAVDAGVDVELGLALTEDDVVPDVPVIGVPVENVTVTFSVVVVSFLELWVRVVMGFPEVDAPVPVP